MSICRGGLWFGFELLQVFSNRTVKLCVRNGRCINDAMPLLLRFLQCGSCFTAQRRVLGYLQCVSTMSNERRPIDGVSMRPLITEGHAVMRSLLVSRKRLFRGRYFPGDISPDGHSR